MRVLIKAVRVHEPYTSRRSLITETGRENLDMHVDGGCEKLRPEERRPETRDQRPERTRAPGTERMLCKTLGEEMKEREGETRVKTEVCPLQLDSWR